ncbi:ketopantoate reductase family protein [Bradyrhizobium sp. USDA 4454]
MRLLVVGAGSTGGYFGGRLAQAGANVAFLVRPARALQLREKGLRLKSPHGDAVLHPKIVTAGDISGSYDAVLLAVKGFQLESAIEELGRAIGKETMIIPVLNGMQHMDVLAKRFSPGNLIGCALKVATTLEDDGSIVQLNPLQDLAYGELDGTMTQRIAALDKFMHQASIGARLSGVIRREMWEKWILLASLGGVTCLMRGPIGEIEACWGGKEFVLSLLDEIVGIVRITGEAPSDSFLETTKEQLTTKGSPLASSMFRDLQRGRPIEVENIIGDLVRRGAAAGFGAPLLSAAYVSLCIYQNGVGEA